MRVNSCLAAPAVLTVLAALTAGAVRADEVAVAGPDGAVQIKVFLRDSRLFYEVTFRGRPVLEAAPLVVTLDGTDVTDHVALGEARRYQRNETYPYRGVHSVATDRCNGAAIPLRHPAVKGDFTLDLRAFNDGVAFRYTVTGDEGITRVPDEATRFLLPAGSTVWFHDLEGHYEGVHQKKALADVAAGQWAAPPMTFRLPEGAYAAITEAALTHYSGMALQSDGHRGFNLVLGHKHHVSYPFRLRYANDVEHMSKPAAIAGTITSPWRVVLVGADLNALVNSDIIPDLCPPPDPTLFPQGQHTDWIKPGRAVWKYLDGGANTFADMKEFSRLAGELGFEYHVIEGFWSRWSDEQVKELVDYSRQRGVGLIVWRHSRDLRTPEAREAFFARLQSLGVAGAKIDFFDHEHRDIVDLYGELLKTAAKHKILLNFHGSNKPTGESRTWPNELVRESVRGMEASRLTARARHETTLPFTRFLAGPADYTPVHFGARRGDTTWAHQVATAAVFTAPLLTYAANPKTLLENPAAPMIKSIPSTWDETVVLPDSEIGELAAYARRSGDTWFLAILNGPTARTLKVPLSFLGTEECQALVVRDDPNEAAAERVENTTARRGDTLAVDMRSGGGFIARFTKR